MADMVFVAAGIIFVAADTIFVAADSVFVAATSVGTGFIAAAYTDAAFAGSGASIRTWRMATMAAAALG